MKIAIAYLLFSHCWFATPQLVLQADWQEVWHSPQPPFLALSHRLRVSRVLILSMIGISDLSDSNWISRRTTRGQSPKNRRNFSISSVQSQGVPAIFHDLSGRAPRCGKTPVSRDDIDKGGNNAIISANDSQIGGDG